MKPLFILLALCVFVFGDNIPQRGVNTRIEYLTATGNGSDTLPYTQSITSLVDSSTVRDFYLEVSKGSIPGHSKVNKFGANGAVAVTGEDIWSGGGTYKFYPHTAEAVSIVSTNAADDSGGTGAWAVLVFGLDSNWEEAMDTVVLNGTTPVSVSTSYIRMYRGIVISCGSYGTNEGNIFVDSDVDGDTALFIEAEDGQTQQAIYTIPGDKTGYFLKGYVALGNNTFQGESGLFQWQARLNNGINGAWATKGQVTLINIGDSYWIYEYGVPSGPLPPKTDIRILVKEATDVISAEGGYDLILVDN